MWLAEHRQLPTRLLTNSQTFVGKYQPDRAAVPILVVSSAAILHFTFWLGPGIRHGMALYLTYGAACCTLHHFSSLSRFKGSWGQLWPTDGPKLEQTKTTMIISPRGFINCHYTCICKFHIGLKYSRACRGPLWPPCPIALCLRGRRSCFLHNSKLLAP